VLAIGSDVPLFILPDRVDLIHFVFRKTDGVKFARAEIETDEEKDDQGYYNRFIEPRPSAFGMILDEIVFSCVRQVEEPFRENDRS
jgi:hypothetical protein